MNVTLHDYQEAAVTFAMTHPKCGLFLELGLGKTLISLSVIERLYQYETGHILIIAPKSIAKATWINEIKKWGLNLPYQSFIVNEKGKKLSAKKRKEAYQNAILNPVKTIYFINRDLIADLVENCPIVNGKRIWAYQTVIVDELQSFKSPSSRRFKALKSVMPAVSRFIGLTGTPTPNGIEDIWSEIYLMDGGARLGKNITAFRRNYMHPGYTNQQGVVCKWLPNDGAEDIIYDAISDIVISMKNNVHKLPAALFIDDHVYMSSTEMKLYKQFVETAVLEFDQNTVATAVNAAVMSAKLQQMASGAIYTSDDTGKPTGNYRIIHEQKLERLQYIRENSDDSLLIAYHFKSDADMIMNYCKSLDIPCEIFDSDKADEYERRWNDKEIPMMLIQPASAGFGLNFQYGGHTLIWYTLPFSLEEYLQTIGRLLRQGQIHTVYIHTLMADKTIDHQILNLLTVKNKNMTRLLNAVELCASQEEMLEAFSEALSLSAKSHISKEEMMNAVNTAIKEINCA